jgi:ATP-dependent protease ClpP protease subunit
MEELLFGESQKPKSSVWDDYVPIVVEGRHIDIYLTDAIDAPSEYNKACHLLSNAYKGDSVTLHINNGGGYVDSGFMLVDAIKHTKATVTAKLSGTVASVATIITLACNDVIAADYLQFMIHNYSGGASGKGHEMKAQMDFTDSELNKAFAEIYNMFLTEHEMELVIAGKDIWMGKEELLGRLKARKNNDLEALKEIEANRKAK